MRVNFDTVLKNLDGSEMEEPERVRGEVAKDSNGDTKWRKVTLGQLCSNAVGALVEDDKLPFKERDAQGALAVRIYEGEHEVTAEEITTIRKMCAKAYTPLICHQIGKLLEPPQPKLEAVTAAE